MRRLVLGLLVATLTVVTTGCSSGAPQDLAMGVRDARSAVASARLAVDELHAGTITGTVASVMVGEAHTRVGTASQTVSDLTVTARRDAALQDDVIAAVRQGEDAVRRARALVDGAAGAPFRDEVVTALRDAAHELDRVAGRAGPPR